MPTAYSYVRFSTPEQASGDSLRRQTAAARAWAEANGYELDEGHTDAGVSAWRGGNREQALGRLLSAIQTGEIRQGSVLIVESLDRLSREHVLEALEQLLAIIRAGIEVVTLGDGQRYSRATINENWTQLIVSISVIARANEESERKSQRLKAAWSQKKKAVGSKALTRMCPGWLRVEGQKYALIPEAAATVRKIFELCAAGNGVDMIAKILNQEAVPHFGRSKFGWYSSYVRKILFNEAAIGAYQPRAVSETGRVNDGEKVRNAYPPAVTEELYHAAHAAIGLRRAKKPGRTPRGYANVLSGLARCGCGRPMTFITKYKSRDPKTYAHQYLQCDGWRRGLGCTAGGVKWAYGRAEQTVLEHVRNLDLRRLTEAERDATAEAKDRAAGLEVALERARNRQKRLLAAFGDDSDEAIVAEIRTLGAEVRRLTAEAAQAWAASSALFPDTANGRDRAAHLDRLRAAISVDDESERALARAALAQELRRVLARVEFWPEHLNAYYAAPAGARAEGGFAAVRHTAHTLGLRSPPEHTEQPEFGSRRRK